MFKCPVCQQEYPQSIPEFCSVCRWNLQSEFSEETEVNLEEVRLEWAREKWRELQALKRELKERRPE